MTNLCFVSGQPPDTLVNALVGVIQSPDMAHILFFGYCKKSQQLSVTMIEITFQTELLLTIYCFTITITLAEMLS